MEYDFNSMINRIKSVKKEKGITNAKLSEMSGVPYGTLNKILGSETKEPSINAIIKISKALGVSTDYIISGETQITSKVQFSSDETNIIKKYRELDTHGKKMVDIVLDEEYERCIAVDEESEETPVFEIRNSVYKVSAGTGYQLDVEEWETIEIPDTYENRQADFALTISGNSMEPVYHDGDIVLVKAQQQIELGEIGIFIINDEGYIKKYGGNRLISLNDDYDDIVFSEGDYIKCCGKVIGRV